MRPSTFLYSLLVAGATASPIHERAMHIQMFYSTKHVTVTAGNLPPAPTPAASLPEVAVIPKKQHKHIAHHTVVVTAGNVAAAEIPGPPVASPQEAAVKEGFGGGGRGNRFGNGHYYVNQHKEQHYNPQPQPSAVLPTPTPQPVQPVNPPPQAPPPQPPVKATPQPPPAAKPSVAPQPKPKSSQPAPAQVKTNPPPSGGDNSPKSGKATLYETITKYRTLYADRNLPDFSWADDMASYSLVAGKNSCGGCKGPDGQPTLKHTLSHNGGQVITMGSNDDAMDCGQFSGPFEVAYVAGWLCEVNDPELGDLCAAALAIQPMKYYGQTGHNGALAKDNYARIGCAFFENTDEPGSKKGLWTCDLQ